MWNGRTNFYLAGKKARWDLSWVVRGQKLSKSKPHDIEGTGWFGLFPPAKTPADIINRLNGIIVGALAKADIKDRILTLGLQPTGTSPEAFAKIQQDDVARWAPAIKASGFTPQQ